MFFSLAKVASYFSNSLGYESLESIKGHNRIIGCFASCTTDPILSLSLIVQLMDGTSSPKSEANAKVP